MKYRPRINKDQVRKNGKFIGISHDGWDIYDSKFPYKSIGYVDGTTYVVADIDGVDHSIGTKIYTKVSIEKDPTIFVAIRGDKMLLSVKQCTQ